MVAQFYNFVFCVVLLFVCVVFFIFVIYIDANYLLSIPSSFRPEITFQKAGKSTRKSLCSVKINDFSNPYSLINLQSEKGH